MDSLIRQRGEFGRYLYDAYKRHLTGSISVKTKNNTHTLFLKEGKPVSIKEQKTTMPLGRVFVELGMIDTRAYDESLMEMAKTGERQGEILLKKGIITQEQLRHAINTQFYKKALKLFEISDGEVVIEERGDIDKSACENIQGISIFKLLYNGIKSLNKEHIMKLLPINNNTVISRKDDLDLTMFSLPLSPEETIVVENIRENTPIPKLIQLKVLSDTEIAQLTYFLFLLELVDVSTLDISDTEEEDSNYLKLSGIYKPDFTQEETHTENKSDEKTTLAPIGTDEDIKWLKELYSKYQTMDYFEFFGVSQNPNPDELNSSYQSLLKRINTLKNAVNIDEEMSIMIDQLSYFAEEAYNTLKSEKSRNEYQSVITAYYKKENLDEGLAELEFTKGEIFLKKHNYKEAFESFKRAIEYGGQKPDYLAAYGLALYLNPEEPQRSRETLGKLYIKRGISQNPRCLYGHIFYILTSCLEGNRSETDKALSAALKIFDNNEKIQMVADEVQRLFSEKPKTGEIQHALRENRKDSKGEELLKVILQKIL
jgi:tetratricopeptide (TPR) repeat protein